MIEGRYTGVFSGTSETWGEDGGYYKSKFGNGSWYYANNFAVIYSSGVVPKTDLDFFQGDDYGNSLGFARGTGPTDTHLLMNFIVLTPSEAWGIDKKIDDGLPGVGKIVTRERNGVNCNTLASSATTLPASYSYNLSYEGVACELEFKNMW